jgi:hypothetical protein
MSGQVATWLGPILGAGTVFLLLAGERISNRIRNRRGNQ